MSSPSCRLSRRYLWGMRRYLCETLLRRRSRHNTDTDTQSNGNPKRLAKREREKKSTTRSQKNESLYLVSALFSPFESSSSTAAELPRWDRRPEAGFERSPLPPGRHDSSPRFWVQQQKKNTHTFSSKHKKYARSGWWCIYSTMYICVFGCFSLYYLPTPGFCCTVNGKQASGSPRCISWWKRQQLRTEHNSHNILAAFSHMKHFPAAAAVAAASSPPPLASMTMTWAMRSINIICPSFFLSNCLSCSSSVYTCIVCSNTYYSR